MPWIRLTVSAVAVLVAYYAMPVEWAGTETIGPAVITLIGVVILTGAIVGQLRKHWFSDAEVRLPLLITLAMLVVVVFAYGYYALETTRPGQMADLETRTDSLYFTVQVLTTVGLGDVHAVGQTARAMVAVQMAFDLVFVAAGGSLLASVVRTRIDQAQGAQLSRPSTGTGAGSETGTEAGTEAGTETGSADAPDTTAESSIAVPGAAETEENA